MNLTETAAWIGAVTGTLALLLQVVKWIRSGTRLEISSNPNMIPIDRMQAKTRDIIAHNSPT